MCTKKINIPIDDNQKFSIREYRNKLYSDIHKRKKELRRKILAQHQAYYQQMGHSGQSQASQSQASHNKQYSQQQQYSQ